MLKSFLIALYCLILVNPPIINASEKDEVRGVWVVRHQMKSAESIDALIEFADKLQFTDLFVQVRGRGDAYYNSHWEPRAEGLADDFDPLHYLLQKSAAKSLRIHAWINVFYLWSAEKMPADGGHLANTRPEWIVYPLHYDSTRADSTLKNRRNIEGLYHSPLIDDVQKHLQNIVEDILSQYPVDGIHFDYIRYPGYDFDFNPVARKKFKDRFILDPLEFKREPEKFVENFGSTGYEIFFARWANFLRSGLSEFVMNSSNAIHKNYPGTIVSAAVKPDLVKAHWEFYQEWDLWLKEGWLDWAIPMNYTKNQLTFLKRIESMMQEIDPSRLIMGVALYNQPPASSVKKLDTVQSLNLRGHVVFSYDQIIKNSYLQRLYLQTVFKQTTAP